MLKIEDFIQAFTSVYNYDEIDEKYFEDARFIEKINECIDDYEYLKPSKKRMAEDVYDTLYSLQYGDTSDIYDLEKIEDDINDRFPDGR